MIVMTFGRRQPNFLEKILQEPKEKNQVEENVNQQKRDPFAKEMGRTRILTDQGGHEESYILQGPMGKHLLMMMRM